VSLESRAERLVVDHGGPDALSITEFYGKVDRAIRTSFPSALWITGEIRSMKVLPRGHCFIDLVDPSNAQDSGAPTLNIKCWSTRWRSVRSTLDSLGIILDAGMVVRVRGEVQFYPARGTVDFILSELDTDALLGKVAAERTRLVKALVDERLFDRQRSLHVPPVPLRVGLVASPETEGCNDFLGGLRSSGLAFAVTVAPTAVQGKGAPARVARAITRLGREPLDVIVVVRGGGSKADLAAFDAEPVARAIATSKTPIWTGIGHTGDQSVADEVANRAFITPTECGQELARVVSDYWTASMRAGLVVSRHSREMLGRSEQALYRHRHGMVTGTRSQLDRHADHLVHGARALRGAARGQIETRAHHLEGRAQSVARSSRRSLDSGRRALDVQSQRLVTLPGRRLQGEELRSAQWRRLLGAYDYRRLLERGYSVTRDESGRVVRSAAEVAPGSRLVTRLTDGDVMSIVTSDGVAAASPQANQNDDEGTQ
jgi:exodeoxyribonuclease VII large subunit